MVEKERRHQNRRSDDPKLMGNRTHLEMEQSLRRINAETINKLVPDISVKKLEPFFTLVAEARGSYIKSLLAVTDKVEGLPTEEQVRELSLLRKTYDELIHGAQALETIISRGYIDVER